jgi:bacterial/archaeal transporter family-2 protein
MGASVPLGMSVVMMAAGIGIPIMAALNSGLGVRLGNPVAASSILLGMALVVSLVLTLSRPLPEAGRQVMNHWRRMRQWLIR